PAADIPALCQAFDIPVQAAERGLEELLAGRLLTVAENEHGSFVRTPTPEGEAIAQRLIAERRASLARLCQGWAPDQHPDLARLLSGLARELAAEPAPPVGVPA